MPCHHWCATSWAVTNSSIGSTIAWPTGPRVAAPVGEQLPLLEPGDGGGPAPKRPSRHFWAWLLRRVFGAELEECVRWGGRMWLVRVASLRELECPFSLASYVERSIMCDMQKQLTALVRARRAELGWTHRQLARAMGGSTSAVCRMESGQASVALVVRALEAMQTRLVPLAIDDDLDPMRDPALTSDQLKQVSTRILHRAQAQQIVADRDDLDVSDVEHALYNLTLTPTARLARMSRGR